MTLLSRSLAISKKQNLHEEIVSYALISVVAPFLGSAAIRILSGLLNRHTYSVSPKLVAAGLNLPLPTTIQDSKQIAEIVDRYGFSGWAIDIASGQIDPKPVLVNILKSMSGERILLDPYGGFIKHPNWKLPLRNSLNKAKRINDFMDLFHQFFLHVRHANFTPATESLHEVWVPVGLKSLLKKFYLYFNISLAWLPFALQLGGTVAAIYAGSRLFRFMDDIEVLLKQGLKTISPIRLTKVVVRLAEIFRWKREKESLEDLRVTPDYILTMMLGYLYGLDRLQFSGYGITIPTRGPYFLPKGLARAGQEILGFFAYITQCLQQLERSTSSTRSVNQPDQERIQNIPLERGEIDDEEKPVYTI